MTALIPILLLVLVYVALIRPQQARVRRQRELISSLTVGSEIQTIGGILGRIVALDDDVARVEVAPGLVIPFVRAAIARVVESPVEADLDLTGSADDATAAAGDVIGAEGVDGSGVTGHDGRPDGFGPPDQPPISGAEPPEAEV
ncbi:MAG TPA: preprotein translocase subunit YajC [Acidimicrobiales bacterium]|nr:preprotein translocase subunit YajC [Acidimicrobiales bacterium]